MASKKKGRSLTPREMRTAAGLYKQFNAPMSAARKGAKAGSKVRGLDAKAIAQTAPLEKATGKPSWKLSRQIGSEYAGGKGARRGEERGRAGLRLEREATRKEGSRSFRLAKAAKASAAKAGVKKAKKK